MALMKRARAGRRNRVAGRSEDVLANDETSREGLETSGDVYGMIGPVNERLRTTMLRAGVTVGELAECAGVEAKTVERWVSLGRVPHREHRWATARRLGADETYLWPEVLSGPHARRQEASRSELVDLYPDRASVPRELWLRLASEAQEVVDVLVSAARSTRRRSRA